MANYSFELMAIEPEKWDPKWFNNVIEIFRTEGFKTFHHKNSVHVWRDVKQKGVLKYSDALTIKSIEIAQGRRGLGISNKRLYFKNSSEKIDTRPELEITKNPPHRDIETSKNQQIIVRNTLKEKFGRNTSLIELEPVDLNLSTRRIVQIGNNKKIPPYSLNSLYKSLGFDRFPQNFTVRICPLEGVSDSVVSIYKNSLIDVANARKTEINIKKIEKKEIINRLNEMEKTNAKPMAGVCILFILPHHAEKPTNETLSLLNSMDNKRVPFRRCFSNDDFNFSIPDQFPSILFAAGGIPHRSGILDEKPIWTVGIDLGHNPKKNISTLAVTLVDPSGILTIAWLTDHPRDETIDQQKMSIILERCKQELIGRGLSDANILVIRDGKKLKNESDNIYHEKLTSKLTFLELKKRGNPQIVQHNNGAKLQTSPCAVIIPGSLTMYLITKAPTKFDNFPSILKVNWKEKLNKLKLSPKDIAGILTTSSAAPGLGSKEHYLPAAIYWADGIAKTNERDLRFRGLPVSNV